MAWYGWSLALTGKLAPMISGFINVGMGWEWTLVSWKLDSMYGGICTDCSLQWWCAIFNAIALVYCFFLMEETNYDRKHPKHAMPASSSVEETRGLQTRDSRSSSSEITPPTANNEAEKTSEKVSQADDSRAVVSPSDSEKGELDWPRKSFVDKLSLKDKPRQNRLLDIALAPFKGFLYPPVVYAGLMYGANSLVWSGTQNATAGTVYTTMYGWNTADVSGAYAGGVIGTILG